MSDLINRFGEWLFSQSTTTIVLFLVILYTGYIHHKTDEQNKATIALMLKESKEKDSLYYKCMEQRNIDIQQTSKDIQQIIKDLNEN